MSEKPLEYHADETDFLSSGLTEEEAAARRSAGQGNTQTKAPGKSIGGILLKNLFTPFNLLNFFLAACLLAVQSYRNMLFLGVVFSNFLIGTVQEIRARKMVEDLQLLNAPKAHVLRGGKERVCSPEELVLGDLVVLRAGDEVPADAEVLAGEGRLDESLLTGESDPVSRKKGEMIMSGSFVVYGQLTARLVRVGDASYAAGLTASARAIRQPVSEMMTDMKKLVRFVSLLMLPLGILLLLKQTLVLHVELPQTVPTVVAAMIGMIPEGLMLLTSVALAVGVMRLGRKNTLVQEMYSIENLARVDVLCLDKTGTLTTGNMRLERVFPLEAEEEELLAALKRFAGAFDMTTPTLRAIQNKAGKGEEKPVSVVPFSSDTKRSAATFSDGVTLVLGAPGFVPCGSEKASAVLAAETEKGCRVMVLAETEPFLREEACPPVKRVLGLISISDEIRENAAQILAYFAEEGVSVKLISGDDPRTVSAVAGRLGLPGWNQWVDASQRTQEELCAAAEKCTVFGRVTPEQKKLLVTALQAKGHHVGMTGDGLNDIPALKAADCSISMGTGADAARRVSQIILLDNQFASLPHVVREGRRIIGNIARSATLFLVKTLFSAALCLLTLVFPLRYPFQPIQLTLISSLTIGIPGFVLSFEPNAERFSGNFLRTVLKKAVPGAAAVTGCALLSMICEKTGVLYEHCATMAVLSAGIMGLMELGFVCRPFTRLRGALLLFLSLLFSAAVAFFDSIFSLTVRSMPQNLWAIVSGVTAVGACILWVLQRRMFRNGIKKKEDLSHE